jgi:perosamine synthetase
MLKNLLEQYQDKFAIFADAKSAIATALGRHALALLLKALNVNEGDRVGVCAFTCLSVIEAVKVVGALPVYLDVDEHLCINPTEISKQSKNSLKAVILQHTFGNPGKLDNLIDACNQINSPIIEDCAHALGCSWRDKALGQFGVAAIYSFQWGKPYSTGQGGMLTINSKSLLARVDEEIARWAVSMSVTDDMTLEFQRRIYSTINKMGLESHLKYLYFKLRDKGIVKGSFSLSGEFKLYQGYAKLAGERMSAVGLKQLEQWPQLQKIRRENVALIKEAFSKAGLPLWPIPPEADITMLRYPLLSTHKTEILQVVRQKKCDIAGWYNSPVHPLGNENLAKVDYRMGDCPQSESFITRLLHIPTGLSLSREKLDSMIGILAHKYWK